MQQMQNTPKTSLRGAFNGVGLLWLWLMLAQSNKPWAPESKQDNLAFTL